MEFQTLRSNENLAINESVILTPNIIGDKRGFFFESWNQKKFDAAVGKKIVFCQDNHSRSVFGVLRGLHYQLDPNAQGKLVRCTAGSIFDVAVDIRKSSSTFGKWGGVELSYENKKQLWIPRGFAHGFLTTSEYAEVQYKTDGFWHKDSERSIRWDDKELQINWQKYAKINKPILAKKDAEAPTFIEAKNNGDIF